MFEFLMWLFFAHADRWSWVIWIRFAFCSIVLFSGDRDILISWNR